MMDPPPPPSLIPPELRAHIPNLYSTDEIPDPTVQVKLFAPWTNWTWFITEFDGEDTCFGLVVGHEAELGYFSLAEMESIKGPGGLRIERDLHFQPKPLSAIRAEIAHLRGNDPEPG